MESLGFYSQYSASVGFNTAFQVFFQTQGSSTLSGMGDIAALSAGFAGGWSSTPLQTGVETTNVTAAYLYAGRGASFGFESNDGSTEVGIPDEALPKGVGRFGVGAGLAAGLLYGQSNEFTSASKPYFGCGGEF